MEDLILFIKNCPPVFMPESTKTPHLVNPRIGYTALNCLSMIDGKVVTNEDKYFSSISRGIQENCRKNDDVLKMAKDLLKQVNETLKTEWSKNTKTPS